MLQPEKDDLLDLIYESAYEPAVWPVVFERLAEEFDGTSVWLSQLDVYDGSGGTADDPNARVDPAWLGRYADYYGAINPLQIPEDPRRYLREWRPVVLTDEDWMAKDDLVRTEFYNDFCKPQDVHSIMWIRMAISGSNVATLNITRAERMGRYTDADFKLAREFQPHLIRAFKMGKRLGLERRRQHEIETLLDLSANGFFLLDADGAIRHVNRAGERLLAQAGTFGVVHGGLRAVQPSISKQLEALIARAASPDAETRRSGSMAIPSPNSALPLSVLVTPIGGHNFAPVRDGLSVCVCVTDLNARMQLPRGPLRNVFGLTDAEIRVAQALFEGASLQEAAARYGISHNTVRVQLAGIFDKTNTNRQVDLIALLSRLSTSAPIDRAARADSL